MMSEPTAPSSWKPSENDFSFDLEVPKHIARGWERAPQSPHVIHTKGHKVWKRPEIKAKDATILLSPSTTISNDGQAREPLTEKSANTPRPVKRLRLKDAPEISEDGECKKSLRYLTTMQDGNSSTPRRKHARRKSLKPDQRDESSLAKEPLMIASDAFKDAMMEDIIPASESPALEEVRQLLDLPDPGEIVKEDESHEEVDNVSCHAMDDPIDAKCLPVSSAEDGSGIFRSSDANSIASPAISSKCAGDGGDTLDLNMTKEEDSMSGMPKTAEDLGESYSVTTKQETAVSTNQSKNNNAAMGPSGSANTNDLWKGKKARQVSTPTSAPITPLSKRTSTRKFSRMTPNLRKSLNNAIDVESPQIGVTLLRRESLRRKESPRRKEFPGKSKTPQKKLLKKRDTLQEREILQKFSDSTSPAQGKSESPEALIANSIIDGAMSSSPIVRDRNECIVSIPCIGSVIGQDSATANAVEGEMKETLLESKDLQRAVEAIEVCEKSASNASSAASESAPTPDSAAKSDIDEANKAIAKAEIDQAAKTIAVACEKAELPNRKTRSGARFSDDTSMLKDFLNRAQARKAAKGSILPIEAPNDGEHLRRSPRKASTPKDCISTSPQKPIATAQRPSTPPGRSNVDVVDSDEAGDIADEPASIRRSARTRLPALPRSQPGAPSLIPVRRADGTDPVILQKSQAQELAVVTRANTRRNKGQSKPPLLALQDIVTEVTEPAMPLKPRAVNAKAVIWAERLAAYQDSTEAVDHAESDQKPKAKKLRGLGAMNGTPAAKRTPAVPTSNGTPAPKPRGKMR